MGNLKQRSAREWSRYLWTLVRNSLAPTALMALFWLLLGWVRAAGVQWVILWPLNFLTGALSGLEGSALGGTIGKAILLVIFNSFFRGIVVRRKGDERRRVHFLEELKKESVSTVLARIPQYGNLRLLTGDRTPLMLGCGLLGVGIALASYPFLTGNGSLVNSMVCVALFLSVGKQISKQRGLLITLLNIVLARKALRTVNRSAVDRVFAGFAVGMAAAVLVAAVRAVPLVGGALWMLLARVLPWVLILAGVGCFGWTLWKARQIQPAGQGAGK